MPIFIPQTELDIAIAESRKADGILDEIPPGCFTVPEIQKKLECGHCMAMRWAKRNGTFIGIFGPRRTKVFRLNKQRANRRRSK